MMLSDLRYAFRTLSRARGFTLMEVVIAIAVLSFCLIVVIANNASNVVPSGITLGGTALTDDASFTSSGANQAASFWSLPNVASGQTSVVITHSATWSPGVTVLEDVIGAPVALLSTSPQRDDTILMRDPFQD